MIIIITIIICACWTFESVSTACFSSMMDSDRSLIVIIRVLIVLVPVVIT